jgi:hypothetical protein
VCKSEGERPLGRPRRRCEDNIEKYLKEAGQKVVDWFYLPRKGDK